jgi:hypothetical protein
MSVKRTAQSAVMRATGVSTAPTTEGQGQLEAIAARILWLVMGDLPAEDMAARIAKAADRFALESRPVLLKVQLCGYEEARQQPCRGCQARKPA